MNKRTAYGVLLAYKSLRESTAMAKDEEVDLTITGKLLSFSNIYQTILSQKPDTKPSSQDYVCDFSFTAEPVYSLLDAEGHDDQLFLDEPDLERFSNAVSEMLKEKLTNTVAVTTGENGVRVFCKASEASDIQSLLASFHAEKGGFMTEDKESYVGDALQIRSYKLPTPLVLGLISEKEALASFKSFQQDLANEIR